MSKIEHVHHKGARVGYRDDGEGKPLILVHGTGGDGEANFDGLLPHLSRRRVLRPDYAGSGLTVDAAEVLTVDHLVHQVIATVDHAGIDSFDLAGFSLGSAVAVRLAALHPGRVDRLVLIGGFIHAADPRSRLQFKLWADLARKDPATLARLMMLTGFSYAFLSAITDLDSVIAGMVSGGNWEGVARQAELDLRVDVSRELGRVKAPTLVIGNRCDQMVDPAASIALAAGIADATLAWLEGPHLALMERPDVAADLLMRHLAD